MIDIYKCEKCGHIITEWEMNFKYASEHGKCLCHGCILQEMEPPKEPAGREEKDGS